MRGLIRYEIENGYFGRGEKPDGRAPGSRASAHVNTGSGGKIVRPGKVCVNDVVDEAEWKYLAFVGMT